MNQPANVRCADCGYLALRQTEDFALAEANDEYRKKGKIVDDGPTLFHAYPFCFRMAAHLDREAREYRPLDGNFNVQPDEVIVVVLGSDRQCDKFTAWNPGFTPKEHAEHQEQERRDRVETGNFERTIRVQKWAMGLGALAGLAGGVLGGALGGPLVDRWSTRMESQHTPRVQQQAVVNDGRPIAPAATKPE